MDAAVPLAAAAALGVCGGIVLLHADEEVYAIPGWGVTITVALLVVGLAGAAAIAVARRPALSAAVLAGSALIAFGLLAILSVGLIALFAGFALLASALRRAAGPRRAPAVAGAAATGAVLPLLLILAGSRPVVDCEPNGASAGENLFMSLGSDEVQGEDISSLDWTGGRARGETYEYTYTCRDGRLVEFELRWR